MEPLDISFKRYLKEMLDIDVQPKKWKEAENLPLSTRRIEILKANLYGCKSPIAGY